MLAEKHEEMPVLEEAIVLCFNPVFLPVQKCILELHEYSLSLKNGFHSVPISLIVRGGEHVGIIGRNGIGKTTLLKQVHSILKDRSDLRVGYMPQNYDEIFDLTMTPICFLQQEGTKEELTLLRSYLGSMKFTRSEMESPIFKLSGGSKAKLFLISFLLQQKNVLLLDEPTRNLSPLSNPGVRESLAHFQGTIISISHDRKYLQEVCQRVYSFSDTEFVEVSLETILK